MTGKDKFYFLGIWVLVPEMLITYGYIKFVTGIRAINSENSASLNTLDFQIIAGIILIPWVIVLIINLYRYVVRGDRDFGPRVSGGNTRLSMDKRNAMKPPINRKYLSKHPDGWTIGKNGSRYVRIPVDKNDIMHTLVIGAPGSMKSTTILNALIWNFNEACPDQKMTVFCIDVKPELQRKSVIYDANGTGIKVINPASQSPYYYGFDPYYGLSQNSSDDELEERMDTIARSLIACKDEDKNAVFYHVAQNLMTGFLLYGFRKGLGFIDSMLQLMSVSVKDLIAEIMADEDMIKQHPKLRLILQVHDGDDSEMLQDAENTMHEWLRIFGNSAVQYCFRDNPRKASPKDLTEGNSVFLSIPDNKLEQYKAIFRMITQLVVNYLSSIPEWQRSDEDVQPIWLLIDEFGSIGHLDIEGPLARLRSRKVSIWLCAQGMSQLDETYTPAGRRSIVTNCENLLVLSSKDEETNKYLSSLAGYYKETKISTSNKSGLAGAMDTSQTYANEFRPIFDGSDLNRLRKDKKILAFVDGGFFTADKCPYFKIPKLLEKSDQIKAANDQAARKAGVF
ncbi:MAG: type IV secretory system conjugative DNA transfer family protein [Lactimicrobium massiliense]|nr:type IV secretory system conjugative DNA transfer family protein [Lactimicrobium massiliense]MDD6727584.1 type IV secretory system conjugative DNA transfer family protein [Lactimicrobium massiliense]